MNLFMVIVTLAAGWSMHIIYLRFVDAVKYLNGEVKEEVIKISDKERKEIMDQVPEEIKKLNTMLLLAINYMGSWICNLQERALPKDKQMSKEQWVNQAIELASMDMDDDEAISKK